MTRDIINKWKNVRNNSQRIKILMKPFVKQKLKNHIPAIESIHTDVFKSFDCLQCANCCTSIPPIVSSRDSKRIAAHLGVSKKQFSEKYLTTDNDGDTVINASPCPFLEDDNRCKIYEVRPSACRQYPHSGDYQFIENLNLHQQNIRYCPALFEIIKRISILSKQ